MPLRFQPARGASVLLSSTSRGPAGAAATITVGTVTTGAQGTSASVTNSGTSAAAVFDISIPRGSSPVIGWNFDSGTTDADPGAGDFRLNHATPASATAAYFDNTERGGATVTTFLDSWDDTGDSSTRGHLVLMDVATPTTFHIFHVSGSIVDGTGYRKVTIAHQSGNGSFTNGNHVSVAFFPAGPAATANSFETINCPSGTDPVASTSTDTLNLAASTGLSITGDSATDTITFAPANDLAALEALSSTGIISRTGSESYAQRTITAPAAGITVSNGDGVSGNPTLALANDLAAYEGLSSTGLVARTGDGTAAARTLTAPAAGITVSNGDGVSGNPTLALADDLAGLEGLSTTGFVTRTGSGTYAQRSITGTANEITVSNGDGVSGAPTLSLSSTANPVGKHTIWVPASAMLSATTSGPASAQFESGTNDRNFKVLDFDASADEHAHFNVAFPKGWNESTVTFQAFWMSTATDTDGVAWALEGAAISDNETTDPSWGTAVVVTDDAQSNASELYVTSESAAVTIGGTPAEGDVCYFRVFRDVSDANDDMTEDARLIGIKLHYTINAATDA